MIYAARRDLLDLLSSAPPILLPQVLMTANIVLVFDPASDRGWFFSEV